MAKQLLFNEEARKKLSPDDVSTKRMILKYEQMLRSNKF